MASLIAALIAAGAVAAATPAPPVATPAPRAVEAEVDTPVLNRAVERGERIGASDLSTEKRPVAQARGALGAGEVTGMEATRRLAAGTVLRRGDVAAAQVIHRGDDVTIAFQTPTMRISTAGRALANGGVGDPVRVVSLATNRTLDAVVEGAGRVRLAARVEQ